MRMRTGNRSGVLSERLSPTSMEATCLSAALAWLARRYTQMYSLLKMFPMSYKNIFSMFDGKKEIARLVHAFRGDGGDFECLFVNSVDYSEPKGARFVRARRYHASALGRT